MKSLKSQFSIDEQSVLEYIFSRVLKAFPKAECTENEKKHISHDYIIINFSFAYIIDFRNQRKNSHNKL